MRVANVMHFGAREVLRDIVKHTASGNAKLYNLDNTSNCCLPRACAT